MDPLIVESAWFEILLPSLQLVASHRIPEDLHQLAESTLIRLHLVHDERVMRQRRAWYELFQERKLSFDGLRQMAPLIADAVERVATSANPLP